MKRVLISFVAAGALLGQLGAAEIYKDGDKSFGVFGTARAVVGYGWNFDSLAYKYKETDGTKVRSRSLNQQNDLIYGIQGNSRIGINFTVGKVFGAALIGASESTFYGDTLANTGGAGFRQLYAGYDFGDAGKLLAGKNELITSMGGFSSDIFDTDSGQNGFGGTSTSTRRFQIAYSVAGLTVAISQNEFGTGASYKNWQKQIPRISLGYEYKDESIRAKVAASYAHKNATAANSGHRDMVLVTAGVRPVFGDAYVSALLTYGLNADLVGETKITGAKIPRGFGVGVTGHTSIDPTATNPDKHYTDLNGSGDRNTYAAMLEFGYNLTNDLAFKVGAGYQFASVHTEGGAYDKLHSYSAFVQLPYKVGGGFSIIPQVGYLGTTKQEYNAVGSKTNYNTGSVLAEVQFNLSF